MQAIRVSKVFGIGAATILAAFALVAAMFAAQPAYAAQTTDLTAGSVAIGTAVSGPTTATVRVGETITINNVVNKAADQGKCTWTVSSSNTGIATANISGTTTKPTLKITGAGAGAANITVMCTNADNISKGYVIKVKVNGIKSTKKVSNGIIYRRTGIDTVAVKDARGCKLTKITIGNTINLGDRSGYTATYKITRIDSNAFLQMKKVKSIKIGNNVETIGNHVFCRCSKLTNLDFGTGLKKIGKQIIHIQNNKLKTIKIRSKKLTKANVKSCFAKNRYLTTVKAPKTKVKAYGKIFTKKNCGKKVTVRKL